MKNLPRNSVIHLEREAEFDKVVMSYPSRTSARTCISIILFIIGLVAANFWYEAFVDLFGNRFELMDLMQLLFTTAIIGFAGFMGKFALRRPVPESLLVVGESIIHDSGTDPFRKTAVDKSEARQNELFFKPRKRMHFSPEEVATLSKTDIPYENRIYLEADGKRHDLGEGLSSAERAWLYDFLLTKLAHPETVSRQAADLIKRVEAEERIKPKITDVHSKHRVDPLDFDDPVAQRANWKTMADASTNFRTHKLAPGRRQLAFKPTRSAQIFGLLFPGVGLIALMLSALELFSKEVTFAFVFLLIFGCLFLASGVYLVRKIFVPIVFDLRRNHFRKGWSDAQPVPLDEVYGLQLLSFMPTGEGVHTGYELNLLLKDGSRRGVVCHGDRESLREHTDTLSQFLDKPVFDGIVPKRQQPHTMRRPIKAEDRSLTWLAVVCLIILVSAIAAWQLDLENPGGAGANESIVADKSTNQPTSVGRPVLFSELVQEARELDGNGKTHLANFYYHEILKQFHNGPTSEPEKTRLLAEVADFFFRKSTLTPDQIDKFLLSAVANDKVKARTVYERVLEMTRDRGRPVAHVDELIQIRDLSTEKRPSTISGMLVFPPGVSSSKPVKRATPPDVNSVKSPDAIWATVDLLTGEILPEGVVIENRFVNNGLIEVSGYADDNGTVAEYLRAIHAKGGRPDLHSVKPEKRDQRSVSEFSITIDPGTV